MDQRYRWSIHRSWDLLHHDERQRPLMKYLREVVKVSETRDFLLDILDDGWIVLSALRRGQKFIILLGKRD